MKVVKWALSFFCTYLFFLIFYANITQAASNGIVISQVKIGDTSSARLVELYNNGELPIDVTNWCLYYHSAASTPAPTVANQRACFTTAAVHERLLLPSNTYLLISTGVANVESDFSLVGGLGSGNSGHVFITNAAQATQDTLGWGTAQHPEGTAAILAAENTGRVLERKFVGGLYVDTDNNAQDFVNSTLRETYSVGNLVEVSDYCQNIEGYQSSVPSGYVVDTIGNCTIESADVCLNLPGIQASLPANMEVDGEGNCYEDRCSNLPGFQGTVPNGLRQLVDGSCELTMEPLLITELLPNPDGTDTSNEFIELYNPNEYSVPLNYFSFHLNNDLIKMYNFPPNLEIAAGQYLAVYNKDIIFTLLNSTGSAILRSFDGSLVGEMVSYSSPKSGESWSLIDGLWQYTDRISPNSENYPRTQSQETTRTSSGLADCGEGRYRNPETNRCRNIEATSSVLQPCAADQERNPETNRCRKIDSGSTLQPCAPDQFRNPETNRCKKIDNDDGLKPCEPDQERNPETNRCRKIAQSLSPAENFAAIPEGTTKPLGFDYRIWGILGLAVVAYGLYEYRSDARNLLERIRSKRIKHKPPG